MPAYVISTHNLGSTRPAGLDYCRRNGLNTSYDPEKWSTTHGSRTLGLDEELLIVENTVVWTLGSVVKRAFDLSEERQTVRQALFAWFSTSDDVDLSIQETTAVQQLGINTKSRSHLFALSNAFKSTANVVHSNSTSCKTTKLQRALVIILDEVAYIYHEDGRRDLINLPFRVTRAFAEDIGLILERALDFEEFPKSSAEKFSRIPKFFILPDPAVEFGIICTMAKQKRELKPTDNICGVTPRYLVTCNLEDSSVTLWFKHQADETTIESTNSSWKSSHTRRRSSMRTSMASLQKSEDLEDDRRTSAIRPEAPALLDRAVFAGTDSGTTFDDVSNLRKDAFLSHVETLDMILSEKRPITFFWEISRSMTVIYIHDNVEKRLHELIVQKPSMSKPSISYRQQIAAITAIPVILQGVNLVLLIDLHSTSWLRSPFGHQLEVIYPQDVIKGHGVLSARTIRDSVYCISDSEQTISWELAFGLEDHVIQRMMASLQAVLPTQVYITLLFCLIDARHRFPTLSESETFTVNIFACFIASGGSQKHLGLDAHENVDMSVLRLVAIATEITIKHSTELLKLQPHLTHILLSLHSVLEECTLDLLTSIQATRHYTAMAQLSLWLNWKDYCQFYLAKSNIDHEIALDDPLPKLSIASPTQTPPSIHTWLTQLMKGTTTTLMTLETIVKDQNHHPYKSTIEVPTTAVCPITHQIQLVYASIFDTTKTFYDAVELMMQVNLSETQLQNLPHEISIPLREVIRFCFAMPKQSWDVAVLSFIGRLDIVDFLTSDGMGHSYMAANPNYLNFRDDRQTSAQLVSRDNKDDEHGAVDHFLELEHREVTKLLHPRDRRIQEALRILQCHKPSIVQFAADSLVGEAEQIRRQQKFARIVATRTLAIPLGRALLNYNSKVPLPTEKFPISKINFDVKIRPAQVTISEEKAYLTSNLQAWGLFHNGVAAGLSVSKDAQEISASWIVYNKPEELNNEHAGFLLGLGLNGHLRAMATWHAFNYLTSKHTMTSIGLLLGLSASFIGTEEAMITKLLSVHILALLPPGSNELNLSDITQSAGIVGIGLLHYDTGNRKMSEVMLREIASDDGSPELFRDEGYRVSAGIAMGMINVGKGSKCKGSQDVNFVPILVKCIEGAKRESHDLDLKMPGAIIALALIYLRTNDRYIACRFDCPNTQYGLQQIRPDLLLLRAFARGLIMWKEVVPTKEYVTAQLPGMYHDAADLSRVKTHNSNDLALFQILCGVCLAIGFNYAGSFDFSARDFVLEYWDQFMRISDIEDHGVDQKANKIAVRSLLSVLCYASAMIMAGTGDLQVLRRLRRLHYRLDPDHQYGHFMAVEMSIGLLFLSGGQASLNTSDRAICAYVAAFYPVVPNSTIDNRSHLQALRHLWVLGAEARCLVPREINTHSVVQVPISIQLKLEKQVIQRSAPCLLPPLDTIARIELQDEAYWPICLDLSTSQDSLRAMKAAQTLHVMKRDGTAAPYQVLLRQFPHNSQDVATHNIVTRKLAWIIQDSASNISSDALKGSIVSPDGWQTDRTITKLIMRRNGKLSKRISRRQEQVELMLAWWHATTIGPLADRFTAGVPRLLSERTIQHLLLDLWRSNTDSG